MRETPRLLALREGIQVGRCTGRERMGALRIDVDGFHSDPTSLNSCCNRSPHICRRVEPLPIASFRRQERFSHPLVRHCLQPLPDMHFALPNLESHPSVLQFSLQYSHPCLYIVEEDLIPATRGPYPGWKYPLPLNGWVGGEEFEIGRVHAGDLEPTPTCRIGAEKAARSQTEEWTREQVRVLVRSERGGFVLEGQPG